MLTMRQRFWREGEVFVWATGTALAASLLMTVLLVLVVMWNGLGVFWPQDVVQLTLKDGTKVLGELKQRQIIPDIAKEKAAVAPGDEPYRIQLKIGNRDMPPDRMDFHWYPEVDIAERSYPEDAVALERAEEGNFYGFLKKVETPTLPAVSGSTPWERLGSAWRKAMEKMDVIDDLKDEISGLNNRVVRIKRSIHAVEYEREQARSRGVAVSDPRIQSYDAEVTELKAERAKLNERFSALVIRQNTLEQELRKNVARLEDAAGHPMEIPVSEIVRHYRPNEMGVVSKLLFYGSKVVELFVDDPREANTEGGLFPCIFGTVMMIILMSFLSFPLGVMAGIYLREYAKEGVLVRLVRIAVNNLAGIPSIVYGIFGLGFFVYGVGGTIDELFYPHLAPEPQWGTGGILWASLTLGLLTVPVVIVSTEEALGAIPMGVREGSLALGATKFQTLCRVLLPMSSPGIMTGFILAMARAAGEVAPLMITGVVKIAPALPLDGNFPYFHFDRKFMHLGFHIYDIGFQSPNVEAAKPMVYVTTLLLLLIVIVMTSLAIYMRNKMQKRYTIKSI